LRSLTKTVDAITPTTATGNAIHKRTAPAATVAIATVIPRSTLSVVLMFMIYTCRNFRTYWLLFIKPESFVCKGLLPYFGTAHPTAADIRT
jgi:hypothetical protein